MNVAVNGEHTIIRNGKLFVKFLEIGDLQLGDAVSVPLGVQAIRRLCQTARGAWLWLQLWSKWSRCARMLANWTSRSRSRARAGKDGFNSTSANTSIRYQSRCSSTSALTPKLLLPPKLSMLPPTDSISLAICSADRASGSLEQHLAHELGQTPLFVDSFGEHAAFENRAEFHKWQPMIFFHQQAQAVGQLEIF